MTSLLLVGVASTLAVFAIMVKARAGKRKKVEKGEKAEIVKRLLALSERENMAITPTVRSRVQLSAQRTRPGKIHQEPTGMTSRPI
jgi:hypothetical protein